MKLLSQALRDGKVDLFHDSVVPSLVLEVVRLAADPTTMEVRRGGTTKGVIVVQKSSGVDTLADLRGKVIAFEEPQSHVRHRSPANAF